MPSWQHRLLPHPRGQQHPRCGTRRHKAQQRAAALDQLKAAALQLDQRLALQAGQGFIARVWFETGKH